MRTFGLVGALALIVLVAVVAIARSGGSDDGGEDADVDAPFSTSNWETDFSTASVELEEFVGGGPPKDGIPSIDDPKFVAIDEADEWLADREPLAVVEVGGEVRGYPLQIITWHEIVNDEIGGEPIAVTYCPLCNSTVAFKRELDGEAVEFGTTGMLRNSDLVMYDRETESWWQQITAEAVVGERTGDELEVVPSQILSFSELGRTHPDAAVLSRSTGFDRSYGQNPYLGYDDPHSSPFLLQSDPDRSLPPKERVAAIKTGEGSAVVYPFSRLADDAPINDEVEGKPVAVFFDPDVASALDTSTISEGRDAGSAAVFESRVDGRTLDFRPGGDTATFRDRQTGSTWNMSGAATGGELEGTQLDQVAHDDQFWFAVAAFFEDPEIRD